MNVAQEQFRFIDAAIKLQREHGATVISRKEIVNKWLAVDPQKTYGTGTPFGARATHVMREIAKRDGGKYISERGRNANARIVF
jgi:hypothetical protein